MWLNLSKPQVFSVVKLILLHYKIPTTIIGKVYLDELSI